MSDQKISEKAKQFIYKEKIRCSICYEVPIIKEITNTGGATFFITAECLNRHGVLLCAIEDFCSDKTQLSHIKCFNCNTVQGVVDSVASFFYFCKDCNRFFCPKCFRAHYKKFKNTHSISRIDKIDNICKEHDGPFNSFCVDCNMNLCPLCLQRIHFEHKTLTYSSIMPPANEINEILSKLDQQKAQLDIIYLNLDKFVKFVSDKVAEYKKNINTALKFNTLVYNSLQEKRINYQSIVNIKKVLDIDITDVSFIKDIKDEIDKVVHLISSKSTIKYLSADKTLQYSKTLDKDLLEVVKKTAETIKGRPLLLDNLIEENNKEKKEEVDDFTESELLKEIGKTNKIILKKEDIFGDIKKIYPIKNLDIYLMIIDNGIFVYDTFNNDLLNYIDINDELKYNEINSITYYYNNIDNILYLLVGTNQNKIKVYSLDVKSDFSHKLLQEISEINLIDIFCNKKNQLLVLDENGLCFYKFLDGKYNKNKYIENDENEKLKKLYETDNYLVFANDKQDKISFYDKNQLLFSLDVPTDEKTKIFEINKNYVCVTNGCKIRVIDMTAKNVCYCYEKINVNYFESIDVFNNKTILLSCDFFKNGKSKLVLFILEWDENNKIFKEKKNIDDLDCKLICKVEKQKAILYTIYGVNMIELNFN